MSTSRMICRYVITSRSAGMDTSPNMPDTPPTVPAIAFLPSISRCAFSRWSALGYRRSRSPTRSFDRVSSRNTRSFTRVLASLRRFAGVSFFSSRPNEDRRSVTGSQKAIVFAYVTNVPGFRSPPALTLLHVPGPGQPFRERRQPRLVCLRHVEELQAHAEVLPVRHVHHLTLALDGRLAGQVQRHLHLRPHRVGDGSIEERAARRQVAHRVQGEPVLVPDLH